MTTTPLSPKLLDYADVCGRLRRACDEAGSMAAFARKLGVSSAFVGSVLRADRAPTPAMLRLLGVRKLVRYQEIAK